MSKVIFPQSSANVKTWVSDKMAKDLNSSALVEFSFLANAKGSLQLLGEDKRRGSESGSRNGGVCDNVFIGICWSVGVNDLLQSVPDIGGGRCSMTHTLFIFHGVWEREKRGETEIYNYTCIVVLHIVYIVFIDGKSSHGTSNCMAMREGVISEDSEVYALRSVPHFEFLFQKEDHTPCICSWSTIFPFALFLGLGPIIMEGKFTTVGKDFPRRAQPKDIEVIVEDIKRSKQRLRDCEILFA
ncbi:hypothetical protein RHMOL_Rhmol03G0018900 [Rhododendron molle]|uniref:Uncharacterized protein n=1 Tax=Rhododendron molle TaxID=49168 RepID=A0ACC0PAQ0_RHOML|nr:hypothetical protein RHMOL_Rhmol03G0018900 [Rhododendron molle]